VTSREEPDVPESSASVVVDCHQHVGIQGEAGFDESWAAEDLDRRWSHMRSVGIHKCVVLPAPGSAGGFRNNDHAAMNDAMARYATSAADVVLAACATVNPAEPRAACRELERAFELLDMRGVAFHHRYLGQKIDDPRMEDLVRITEEAGRVVFVHIIADSTSEAPWRLFALARRFPGARFVALDGFSSTTQSRMITEFAPDAPNVWFDTGAMTSVAHGLDMFIDKCGAERLMLGTDFYSGHAHFQVPFPLLELRAMGLPQDDLDRICGYNIIDLLGKG